MGASQGNQRQIEITCRPQGQDKKRPDIVVSDIESNATGHECSTNASSLGSDEKKKNSIFNDVYEILSELGAGKSSRVYLAREIAYPNKLVALKLIRSDYIRQGKDMVALVENEITLLNGLKHENINRLISFGDRGKIEKPSGRVITNLVYMLLEYVPHNLFDVCEASGAMGEDAARCIMREIVEAIKYLHNEKQAVHRDLKLENILVGDELNVKVADFGLGAYKNISSLTDHHGTKTYMAPEIKQGKTYDGRQADVFSLGVVMFIIAQGVFPFGEALSSDYFYKILMKNEDKMLQKYWRAVGGESLSNDFKQLFLRMVNVDPTQRPTIEELASEAWLQAPINSEETKRKIIAKQSWGQKSQTFLSAQRIKSSTGKAQQNQVEDSYIENESTTNVSSLSMLLY